MSAEVDVVVVGAGPGGLASALTLGSYGIETLVVERRPRPSIQPRANTLSTGTMELLRRWGLEPAVRERMIDVVMQPLALPTLADVELGEPVEAGFPTRDQAAIVSPTAPAGLGQDELEPLLEDRVRALGTVRVERRTRLVAVEAIDGGYALTIAREGEEARRVHTRYLIGADGVRSTVRSELGIATDGQGTLSESVAVHFRAPLWDVVRDRRHVIYFLTSEPEGRAVLPVGKPDRWVYAQRWDRPANDLASVPADEVMRWIREAAGVADLPVQVMHTSVVGYGVGLAERFREGNAFLIGDAAHRVTPRGATGLNTAIRDGFDLGWKLSWVLRGWSDASLLDTYELERRPVAEFNTARSTRADGSLLGNSIGLNADIGGRIPHVWVERAQGLVSTLDLLGEGQTLFAGPEWDGVMPGRQEQAVPIGLERVDAIAARGLGLTPSGALLARPDGHPVWVWNDTHTAAGSILTFRA